jgi:ELWxxDGT repeat protein
VVVFALLALAGIPGPSPASAQAPGVPVRDIGVTGASSYPHGFVDVGGVAYFLACDAADDLFLWRAGEGGNGARQLARIARYRRTSCDEDGARTRFQPAVLGTRLFFVFDRTSLWVSDGTPEGTGTADLLEGMIGYADPTVVGDRLYFVTTEGQDEPHQLWRTDGSSAGTHLVRTVPARDLVALGDRLLFWGHDSAHGWEPWITDGTRAGTRMVRDLVSGTASSLVRSGAVMGGRAYVAVSRGAAGTELWRSDGTAAGTRRVKDLVPGSADLVSSVVRAGDRLFFSGRDARGRELWTSDGTTAGTRLVRDLRSRGSSGPRGLLPFGDRVVFEADGAHGARIWASDGTRSGTRELVAAHLVSDPPPGAVLGHRLLFRASTSESKGPVLWTTDGTANGTRRVVGASVVHDVGRIVASGGRVYFAGTQDLGAEPWSSDGTRAGTRLLADLDTDTVGSMPSLVGAQDAEMLDAFVTMGTRAWFVANDGAHGAELWGTTGTPNGTHLVKDIRPGAAGSRPSGLVAVADQLFFAADDGTHGTELWTSDGTRDGTRMVRDIRSGHDGSHPMQLTTAGDQLVFTTDDHSLWTTDGTTAGTRRLKSAAASQGAHGVEALATLGPLAYLLWLEIPPGCHEVSDRDCPEVRLWATDGTQKGTYRVTATDLWPAGQLTAAGRSLFFTSGGRLWTSDGTTSGTLRLSTVNDVHGLAAFGDGVVFQGCRSATGCEPWTSDGTPAGTRLIKDITRGAGDSTIGGFTTVGVRVYFDVLADDAEETWTLWVSDGTADGTTQVADIRAIEATAVGDLLVFSASDGDGWEPWVSDGTPDGTLMLADIHPYHGSDAYAFMPLRSGVVFVADDGEHGPEPCFLKLP